MKNLITALVAIIVLALVGAQLNPTAQQFVIELFSSIKEFIHV